VALLPYPESARTVTTIMAARSRAQAFFNFTSFIQSFSPFGAKIMLAQFKIITVELPRAIHQAAELAPEYAFPNTTGIELVHRLTTREGRYLSYPVRARQAFLSVDVDPVEFHPARVTLDDFCQGEK
jgi:hypothetical protein